MPLAQLFEECRSLILPLARARGVEIAFSSDACAGLAAVANFTRLRQIVLNLCSNAIKYNRPNGSVQVRCQPMPNGRLRISVTDTGPGIPAERQQELFEPFNRLGAEMGPVEGTGIGLVITKRLTEMMGGTLGLDSRPGQGSTFWVEFDRAEAEPAPAARPAAGPAKAASAMRRSGTVLYVEDNAINMRLVEKTLANRWPELTVHLATSGEAALALLAQERPDLILLDIGLPGMDGFEILRRIRALDSLAGVPVIALTASATTDDIKRGESAGFDAYLTKPLHIEQLIRTLDAFIQPASS